MESDSYIGKATLFFILCLVAVMIMSGLGWPQEQPGTNSPVTPRGTGVDRNLKPRPEPNQAEIGESQLKQAAELSQAIVEALTGTAPSAESKSLAAAIKAEPVEQVREKETVEGSRQIKQLDNPSSLITVPSEGGTVLPLP